MALKVVVVYFPNDENISVDILSTDPENVSSAQDYQRVLDHDEIGKCIGFLSVNGDTADFIRRLDALIDNDGISALPRIFEAVFRLGMQCVNAKEPVNMTVDCK